MREKLQQLIVELNKNLVGKEDVMKLSLLTMLAGENLILFGPPGTAKSEIARRLSKVFEEDSYFEYLLTKFTTPEEIFGPLSIQELKKDKFRRNVEGYMPNVKITFLDEIFKANSSILNSLLTIINEKVYHNGNEKIKVPLQSLISASNELPIGDNELSALYDRFLVRVVVDYLADDDVEELFDVEDEEFNITDSLKMKIKEIEKIKQEAKGVEIPEEIRACIMEIRKEFNNVFKEDKDEVFSDRKFVKIMKFLKVSAYTNGRDKLDLSDIMLLINCLWNRDNNAPKLSNIITKVVQSHISIKTTDLITSTKSDKKKDSKKTNFDFKGEGTEYNPFLIDDVNDLIHINNSDYLGKGYYFEQMGDIDLSSIANWISIGESEESPFVGHYNGNNLKILNLKGNSGLFGLIEEYSSVINLRIEKINIESSFIFTGGIVNKNKGEISNCYISGNINSLRYEANLGGIIGVNMGDITNSCNTAIVTSKNSTYQGGLVGKNFGKIIDSKNLGDIVSASQIVNKFCSGGIAGVNEGTIINSYNEGKILNDSSAGGLVGENTGFIVKCFNTGDIKCRLLGGGITGTNKGEVESCFNLGSVFCKDNDIWASSDTYGGGIVATNIGKVKDSYNIGNIDVSHSGRLGHQGNSIVGGIVARNVGEIISCTAINTYINGKTTGKIFGESEKGTFKNCYTNQDMLLNGNKISSGNIDLPLSSMNEKFFNRLGWDFDNAWTWDSTENRPILDLSTPKTGTKVSNNKKTIEISTSENNVNIFKENIWL